MNNPFEELQSQLNRIEGMLKQLLDQQYNIVTPKNEQPINIEEVAKMLNISVSGVYHNPDIPRHKRHNRLRFFEAEILDYIKNQSTPVPQQEDSFTPATLRSSRKQSPK